MNRLNLYPRLVLSFAICMSALCGAFAQRTDWSWQINDYGNSAGFENSFLRDAAGNTWICGVAGSSIDANPLAAGPAVNIVADGTYFIKLNASRNLIWAGSFAPVAAGNTTVKRAACLDAAENLLLAGTFTGEVDFNPDPGTDSIMQADVSSFYHSVFVTKHSPSGNLIWARTIGSFGVNENISGITTDADGSVYVCGTFFGTTDLDPSPSSSFIVNTSLFEEGYIIKLDSAGNFVWARQTGYAKPAGLKTSVGGEILLFGYAGGPVDLDPSPSGTFSYTSIGLDDFYITSISSSSALVWAKTIGSIGNEYYWDVATDSAGNLYLAGATWGDPDWNPGTAAGDTFYMPLYFPGSSRTGIVKLDASGDFVWARQLISDGYLNLSAVSADAQGNVWVTGKFTGSADLNPDLIGYAPANVSPDWDGYAVRLDSLGSYTGHCIIHSKADDNLVAVLAEPFGAGWLSTQHGDSATFTGGKDTIPMVYGGATDCLIAHISEDTCDYFQVKIDSVADVTCSGPGFISVHTVTGHSPYTYLWSTAATDTFIQPVAGGIYSIHVTDDKGCEFYRGVILSGPSTMAGYDLTLNLAATTFRPGMPAAIWLDAYNSGCTPINGYVYLVLDTGVSFVSSVPPPLSISGDTIKWLASGLVFDGPHFLAEVSVVPGLSYTSGDTLCLSAWIDPASGDDNPFNNIRQDACYPVQNSYDPNDKRVYPNGVCPEHFVESGTPLTYTIRFQNTGTAEALEVVILDTLSPHLDVQSFIVRGHSHPMHTELVEDSIIRFVFNNIHLPDSTTDEPGSHGYVIFEISAESGLASGTIVHNSCGIYFDLNEAVITNTVHNTYIDSIPACGPVRVSDAFSEQLHVTLSPNPAGDMLRISASSPLKTFRIQDSRGVPVISGTSTRWHEMEMNLNISALPQGVYFLKVETVDGMKVARFAIVR